MISSNTACLNSPRLIGNFMTPGTCGELVQGYIDGKDFLINCPIDLYSTASLYLVDQPGLQIEDEASYKKIAHALHKLAEQFDLPLSHQLVMNSSIPRGKGLASSTADISSAVFAMLHAFDISIPDEQLFDFLIQVEPGDGTHFSGITHLGHLDGKVRERLPTPSGLNVLLVDCGGEVDTVGFNRQMARRVYEDHKPQISEALELVATGLKTANNELIAKGSTISTQISQLIHHKPQFESLLSVTKNCGGLGVNCAHSGTVLGVLYEESLVSSRVLEHAITNTLGNSVKLLGCHQIIGGGSHVYQ